MIFPFLISKVSKIECPNKNPLSDKETFASFRSVIVH
jgi:hypothetical protein